MFTYEYKLIRISIYNVNKLYTSKVNFIDKNFILDYSSNLEKRKFYCGKHTELFKNLKNDEKLSNFDG